MIGLGSFQPYVQLALKTLIGIKQYYLIHTIQKHHTSFDEMCCHMYSTFRGSR